MSRILEGLEGVICLVDDVLIFGRTKMEHDARLDTALQQIQAAGVTLNQEKCEFQKSNLLFLGHIIDEKGILADPAKTEAVHKMKSPTCVSEFMGMVNQLGKFSRKLADLSQPLRKLLSSRNSWIWEEAQEQAFNQVKEELLTPTILALYDPSSETKVSADASSVGMGAVLLQRSREGEWRPVVFASRSLSETEARYAQNEKEVWPQLGPVKNFLTTY